MSLVGGTASAATAASVCAEKDTAAAASKGQNYSDLHSKTAGYVYATNTAQWYKIRDFDAAETFGLIDICLKIQGPIPQSSAGQALPRYQVSPDPNWQVKTGMILQVLPRSKNLQNMNLTSYDLATLPDQVPIYPDEGQVLAAKMLPFYGPDSFYQWDEVITKDANNPIRVNNGDSLYLGFQSTTDVINNVATNSAILANVFSGMIHLDTVEAGLALDTTPSRNIGGVKGTRSNLNLSARYRV